MALDRIIHAKRARIELSKKDLTLERMINQLEQITFTSSSSFLKAIKEKEDMAVIGEIKKASPSKGIIGYDFDPISLAGIYQLAGVAAISVLTESDFFMGDDSYPAMIRQNCELPILRKDFLIDLWQIYQSKLIGAQAVLLIAAILSKKELEEFYGKARNIKLDCLVEVHNRHELDTALDIGANIIGINNRDLKTFSVSIKTTEELVRFIPKDVIVVSESGIDRTNVKVIKEMGVDAILVGEAFMRENDVFGAVTELRRAYA